ncbi:MAG: hypothetical protein IPO30_20310 [Hyphomonadaceae bacterium]|nr:hypothetical protein [Hyphomonadaceae bacterium]
MLFNDRVTQAVSVAPRHNKKVAVPSLDLLGFGRKSMTHRPPYRRQASPVGSQAAG